MIAQIALILALMLVLAYSYTQRRRSTLVCYSIFLLAMTGIISVLFPGATSQVAHFMGIGRGADLVLYSFIMVAMVAILNLHLHARQLLENITENARHIALLEALSEEERGANCRIAQRDKLDREGLGGVE